MICQLAQAADPKAHTRPESLSGDLTIVAFVASSEGLDFMQLRKIPEDLLQNETLPGSGHLPHDFRRERLFLTPSVVVARQQRPSCSALVGDGDIQYTCNARSAQVTTNAFSGGAASG